LKKSAFTIYNASAGSGKTYTLVKEYLKIILTSSKNDAYKSILAITFTNKAVHEMKTRIVDSLFDFTKEIPSSKSEALIEVIAQETGLKPVQIIEKSKAIIKNIIHNYAAFDISTIDKFTHKVIRSFAIDLDLPVTFEVSLDSEKLLQEAVDAIVAEAGSDPELTKLLIEFTLEKTDDDKSWDVSSEIFTTGKLLLNENYKKEISSLKDKSIPQFIALQIKLKETCKLLEEEAKEEASDLLVLIENNGIDLKSFSRGTFPNHLQSIVLGKFNPKNKMFREITDIQINKTAIDKALIESLLPELIETVSRIYNKFEKIFFYEAFLKNITPLSLVNTIGNQLSKIQEEQNILSIAEFNTLINEQIQNQPAPFIYERLGERYKHFFIDEFQDTSEMQWQNLIPLIDNALSSEDLQGNQGSLMIVGDPKQSIYRWRGGKAEQFIALSKSENPFSNKDKSVVHLESNYRSYEEVIRFNNAFFKQMSQKFSNENYVELYEQNSFQKSNSKKGGYVSVSFLPKIDNIETTEEEEVTFDDLYLQKTKQTIEEVLQKGFQLNDIVILVRNNSKGVLLANYLTENHLPVISSESLLLGSSSEVQLVLNLLAYLYDKKNKEALAKALYYFSKNFETHWTNHDFISHGILLQNEEELQQWLSNFGIHISFQSIRKKSLYEVVETLILNTIPHKKQNAYTQFFLDIVLERDVQYQYSIGDFLDYWSKSAPKHSIPTGEKTNAIRIMTIHKSKGLEFPVVIFPFAEQNFSQNKGDKMWLETPDEELDFQKFLIDKSSKVNGFGSKAQETYLQITQEDILDNINVLYVALTRAEEQLYIISTWKEPNKEGCLPNNLASYFIEFVSDQCDFNPVLLECNFGNPEKISTSNDFINSTDKIMPTKSALSPTAIKIAQREALMWGSKQQEAIEYGNLLHKILSYINIKTDINKALIMALEEGLIESTQADIVESTLKQIVLNENLSVFFNEDSRVYNERNIINKNARTIIPDRVVIKNNEAYLLDYKTGVPNQKHIHQMQEYEQVLTQMGYQVNKKALIYIGQNIEIVNL
jgi:ATP-dependent exoDNAse (exonuclease V) beta subunit